MGDRRSRPTELGFEGMNQHRRRGTYARCGWIGEKTQRNDKPAVIKRNGQRQPRVRFTRFTVVHDHRLA